MTSLTAPLAVCLGLLAACDMFGLAVYALHDGPLHMDFFGIWSWARFEIERPAATIYDRAAQGGFLLGLDPHFSAPMPFPYPPFYLLVIRPLGWLPYPAAQLVWSGATLLACSCAVCTGAWRHAAPWLLLAPATAVNLWYGQNGFLTAALLVGGIRLAPSRPILGGVLLGLLAYKPQFGLLIAVAVVAAGLWRAALAAALTVAATIALSLIAFGVAPWTEWIHAMPGFVATVDSQRARLLRLMPTALSNALALGASDRIAGLIQALATALAASAVWIAFRRGQDRPAAAVLAVASVLAAPYAFLYDLTLVAAAIALLAAERWEALSVSELLILAAATLLPAGMLFDVVPPIAAAVLVALLGLLLLHPGNAPTVRVEG